MIVYSIISLVIGAFFSFIYFSYDRIKFRWYHFIIFFLLWWLVLGIIGYKAIKSTKTK